jgi:peptidoglycan/xylan/chitin deacetylase (PgdA/CDA1 family)
MNNIITFHRVNHASWFENMICFLKSKYQLVPIESLHETKAVDPIELKSVCHLTIDDGDRSFYDVIFPVLKKHRVHATLFVSPRMCMEQTNFWFQEIKGYNHIELKRISADMLNMSLRSLMTFRADSILKGMPLSQIEEVIRRYQRVTNTAKKEGQNVTVNELKEIDQSGLVSIGAHTINHPILKNETDLQCQYEIAESVNELASILKHAIRYFAYPNGIPLLDFAEREEKLVRDIGIELAFTTESKGLSSTDNRMRIPRVQISSNERMLVVKGKLLLGSKWNTLKKLKTTGEYVERQRLGRMMSG